MTTPKYPTQQNTSRSIPEWVLENNRRGAEIRAGWALPQPPKWRVYEKAAIVISLLILWRVWGRAT